MDVCVLRCTPRHIPRYIGLTSNNNKDANYVSVVCLPSMLSSDFTMDFRFMIITILYLLTSYFTTCVLFRQSPALILSYHEYFLLDITYYISTCFCMLVLTTRFSMHDYDSVLSIHVCLFLHAIWHSHHHSWGSSDSPRSSCPGPEA